MKLFLVVPLNNELNTVVAQVTDSVKKDDLFFFCHFRVNVRNYPVKPGRNNHIHQATLFLFLFRYYFLTL